MFLKECVKRIVKVLVEVKLEIDEEIYLSLFKFYLMDVVYIWVIGVIFVYICKMIDVFEGMV